VSNLEQRAKMHAALGEPVRLAIIDHLALGDASPGELGQAFDLATNLLAHHLRVLEDAGLIRRVRSEGDRRRSYVQLVLDDSTVTALTRPVASSHPGRACRVLFVCTQNSARSQLAASAWARASNVPAASAGTHPAARVHPRAVSVGRRHGLHLSAARTTNVADVLRPDDLVVAVCDNAYEERPADGHPQLHWAVPDPARIDTDEAFETAYDEITQRVGRLADAVGRDAQRSTS
jgi:ArsR family transcriptional regulator, arsenate/arsenite/antimonite-responsive transcriptional repressor / arsenate reductase (thioredoxin)